MKVYIGRDNVDDMDRICVSTRKLKYLTCSKSIAQPHHDYSKWNFILIDDFKLIKKAYKDKMKGIKIPKIGEIYKVDIDDCVFIDLISY